VYLLKKLSRDGRLSLRTRSRKEAKFGEVGDNLSEISVLISGKRVSKKIPEYKLDVQWQWPWLLFKRKFWNGRKAAVEYLDKEIPASPFLLGTCF